MIYDIKTCAKHPNGAHRVLPFVDGTPAEVECMKCRVLIPQFEAADSEGAE